MAAKTEKRAHEILHLLLSRGKTSVEGLAEVVETSAASVRRDLARLEERGLVHRTHGGAMLAGQTLAGQTYEPFRFDASFQVREDRFSAEKSRIASAAAAMVRDGETIGITAGTTTTEVARALRSRSGLHIVTNAVNIAMEMGTTDTLQTTLPGGCMRWPGAVSLVGPAALETLKLHVLDKLFLSVCGFDSKHGATTIQADEAALFRSMSERARCVIVVADSSKLEMTSPAVICPVTDIDVLVTDDGILDTAMAAFHKAQIEVRVV